MLRLENALDQLSGTLEDANSQRMALLQGQRASDISAIDEQIQAISNEIETFKGEQARLKGEAQALYGALNDADRAKIEEAYNAQCERDLSKMFGGPSQSEPKPWEAIEQKYAELVQLKAVHAESERRLQEIGGSTDATSQAEAQRDAAWDAVVAAAGPLNITSRDGLDRVELIHETLTRLIKHNLATDFALPEVVLEEVVGEGVLKPAMVALVEKLITVLEGDDEGLEARLIDLNREWHSTLKFSPEAQELMAYFNDEETGGLFDWDERGLLAPYFTDAGEVKGDIDRKRVLRSWKRRKGRLEGCELFSEGAEPSPRLFELPKAWEMPKRASA